MNKNQYRIIADYTLATTLGALLTFAFAPYEIFPLAVIAPAGLLALWLKYTNSLKHSFLLGFAFGMGLFGAGVYWIFTSVHVFGGVPTYFAILITIGMMAILACYPAATGYFLNRYFPVNHNAKLVLAFPAIWVFSEWIRSMLFTGFPWLFLGYSQTNSPLKGYAPLMSVYAISLALAICSGLIVCAYRHYRTANYRGLYFNLLTFSLIWVVGGSASFIPWTRPEGKPISVALVQGNIPQTIKWSPEHIQTSIDRYLELAKPLWGKYDIIIWPEAAIPVPLQYTQDLINLLNDKALESHSNLLLGLPIQNPDDESHFYNSLVSLGTRNQVYNKRHLVPFGEYTPFSSWFAKALQFMDVPLSDTTAGKTQQNPLLVGKVKILPSICYEIAFPELTRALDKSINLLLVVTNDAWFGNSSAEPQHLQMAVMRALEFNKPVLFVSNDGITASITPDGRIEKAAPQRQATVLTTSVQPMYGITPWLTNGVDPLLFIMLVFLGLATLRNRQTQNEPAPTQAACTDDMPPSNLPA